MSEHPHEAEWQRWVRERLHEHAERIDIHLHIDGPITIHTDGAGVLQQILHNTQELLSMGTTIQETVDANNAKLAADIDGMQTDLTAITAALQAALPPVGTTVSQASADAMTAQVARLDAMRTAMDALVPPAPAPAP